MTPAERDRWLTVYDRVGCGHTSRRDYPERQHEDIATATRDIATAPSLDDAERIAERWGYDEPRAWAKRVRAAFRPMGAS